MDDVRLTGMDGYIEGWGGKFILHCVELCVMRY